MIIKDFDFSEKEISHIRDSEYGSNWPVVYIINNKKEAYVGETLDAGKRTTQHLQNPERTGLETIHFISDDKFNKSVILDLESFLIRYMASDELFKLQNSNGGVSNHNYYERETYEKEFKNIWGQLKNEKLVKNELADIENSDIFKYSPFKALTDEQYDALGRILDQINVSMSSDEKSLIRVDGGAGTGKTILAVYLMKLISEANNRSEFFDSDEVEILHMYADEIGHIEAALVIPMQSLRKTIQRVFRNIKGLSPDMVISPIDVPKKHYDLLIVDEAHRLRRRKALSQYPVFDKNKIGRAHV